MGRYGLIIPDDEYVRDDAEDDVDKRGQQAEAHQPSRTRSHAPPEPPPCDGYAEPESEQGADVQGRECQLDFETDGYVQNFGDDVHGSFISSMTII